MRVAALSLLLTVSLTGQTWSLASRLVAPTLYVAVDVDFARHLRRVLPTSALARLVRDGDIDLPLAELALLARVTDLCQGTMEVALAGDSRAVVVHCDLPTAAADKVRALMADADLVERVDEVDGVPVGALRDGGADHAARSLFLAVAGQHLLVAADPETVRTLLRGQTSAKALADDSDFRELSRRFEADRPNLTVYGSLADLSAALPPSPLRERLSAWLEAAGCVDARSLLIAVREHGDGLQSTVIVRRASTAPFDGWLAWVERTPLQSLLADLPRGGLGSVTLAFAPDQLRRRTAGSKMASFYDSLAGGCAALGVNLEQQLLQRLKGVVGLQFVATTKQVGSAYVAKAKSERDAQRVVSELRRIGEHREGVRLEPHQAGEELVLPYHPLLGGQPRVEALRDAVVLSTQSGVLEQAALAEAGEARNLPRWAQQAFKNLPGGLRQLVGGTVLVDLSSQLPESVRESAALRQHVGCLRIQPDHLRLELFSQL
ncbi:MAG: hypothetical protein R3F56_25975 [Planctomycetota bacterium]